MKHSYLFFPLLAGCLLWNTFFVFAAENKKEKGASAATESKSNKKEKKPTSEEPLSVEKVKKQKAVESRMILSVIDFSAAGIPEATASVLSDTIRSNFTTIGLYQVLNRDEMQGILKVTGRKIPSECNEIRCLLKVGKLLNVTKVVGGEISNDGKNYAVKMNMIDVASEKSAGRVWLASECSESDIPLLIRAAVLKLHGQKTDSLRIAIKDYRGPEFTRYNAWAMTAGATFVVGLVYAMIDGGLTGRDKNAKEFDPANYQTIDASLSGIPGSFANLGYGARAHAMGNTYTAVSNDVSGILWNPAGIARITKSEVAASYLNTFAGIPYVNVGYVGRFSRTGSFGVAVLHNGDETYSETEFVSTCAKLLDELHPNLRPIALGVNTKIRLASSGKSVTGEDASTGNSFGLSFDAGLQFELADHIEMGILTRDIIDIERWTNTYRNDQYSESAPTTLVIGGSFQASPSLLLVMDGDIPVYEDQSYKMSMGVEKVIFDVLALRAGLSQNLDFWENRRIMVGPGILFQNFSCDASYEFAQEPVFAGSWRISTSWKF